MQNSNDTVVVNGDMSGDITSIPIAFNQLWAVTIVAVWTGAPVGKILLQLSCHPGVDIYGNGIPTSDWLDYAGTSFDINTTVNGNQYVSWVDQGGHKWLRVVYRHTSGSGTLNSRFNAKAS